MLVKKKRRSPYLTVLNGPVQCHVRDKLGDGLETLAFRTETKSVTPRFLGVSVTKCRGKTLHERRSGGWTRDFSLRKKSQRSSHPFTVAPSPPHTDITHIPHHREKTGGGNGSGNGKGTGEPFPASGDRNPRGKGKRKCYQIVSKPPPRLPDLMR